MDSWCNEVLGCSNAHCKSKRLESGAAKCLVMFNLAKSVDPDEMLLCSISSGSSQIVSASVYDIPIN